MAPRQAMRFVRNSAAAKSALFSSDMDERSSAVTGVVALVSAVTRHTSATALCRTPVQTPSEDKKLLPAGNSVGSSSGVGSGASPSGLSQGVSSGKDVAVIEEEPASKDTEEIMNTEKLGLLPAHAENGSQGAVTIFFKLPDSFNSGELVTKC